MTSQQLKQAGEILRAGGLVALPTETVYGLAADAASDVSVAKIFEAKGRPQFNPLIVHVDGYEMAAQLAEISAIAKRLIDQFWPGPLTLVLPKRDGAALSKLVSAGLPTIALRMPNASAALGIIRSFGGPIAAPSANLSGKISPTLATHVASQLGDKVDLIVDGGPCTVGLESTIFKPESDGGVMLRHGAISANEIADVIGAPVRTPNDPAKIEAPGALLSHYAPTAPLRLNAMTPNDDELWIGFDNYLSADEFNLSKNGSLIEAAANLFATLHAADDLIKSGAKPGKRAIAVAPIPDKALGLAINDRLRRAAHD